MKNNPAMIGTKSQIVKVEIVNVTPEIASELLEKNYEGNRKIHKTYVEQLAIAMKAGRYVPENGQTIVRDIADGTVYDGQHRLSAIVLSGTTQRMLVVWVTNGKEAYQTIDNGTKRNTAQYVDLPDPNNSTTVAKYMACVEWGTTPLASCLQYKFSHGASIDRGLVLSYAAQHGDEIVDAVRKGGRMKNAAGGSGPKTMYAFFICLLKYCGDDSFLDEFLNEFMKSASPNLTVNACKMAIMKMATGRHAGRGLDKKWLLGTLLDAYSHYRKMDNSTMLNKQKSRINDYSNLMQHRRDEHRS